MAKLKSLSPKLYNFTPKLKDLKVCNLTEFAAKLKISSEGGVEDVEKNKSVLDGHGFNLKSAVQYPHLRRHPVGCSDEGVPATDGSVELCADPEVD